MVVIFGGETMVREGRGRIFRRKDGKFLIYLPKDLCEDSMFPFKPFEEGKRSKETVSILVKVSFKPGGEEKLVIEKWEEPKAA